MTYKTKPILIEAMQWTLENDADIISFCPEAVFCFNRPEPNVAGLVKFSGKDWKKRIGCVTLIKPDHLEIPVASSTGDCVLIVMPGEFILKTKTGYSAMSHDDFYNKYELALEVNI